MHMDKHAWFTTPDSQCTDVVEVTCLLYRSVCVVSRKDRVVSLGSRKRSRRCFSMAVDYLTRPFAASRSVINSVFFFFWLHQTALFALRRRLKKLEKNWKWRRLWENKERCRMLRLAFTPEHVTHLCVCWLWAVAMPQKRRYTNGYI